MFYLIVTVFLISLLFVIFKGFEKFGVRTFEAIVCNYIVCVLTGIAFLGGIPHRPTSLLFPQIEVSAILLGISFISTFYFIGRTTQISGVAITSLAGSLSFIIPTLSSLWIFKFSSKPFDVWNFLGLLIAILCVFLSAMDKSAEEEGVAFNWKKFIGPVGVFWVSGLVDGALNAINKIYIGVDSESQQYFTILLFGVSASIGVIVLISSGRFFKLERKSIIGGLCLGIPNYFSILFMLKALEEFQNDGALVFPFIKIGVIILSAVLSALIFSEKIKKYKGIALLLAILALFGIAHQEILAYINV